MSLQNWASNGPFAYLPVHRRMNAKNWSGIKNCQGKSKALGVAPFAMTLFLPRGTFVIRNQRLSSQSNISTL